MEIVENPHEIIKTTTNGLDVKDLVINDLKKKILSHEYNQIKFYEIVKVSLSLYYLTASLITGEIAVRGNITRSTAVRI